MSTAEQLAQQAAEGVRALIADAESKAAEIVQRAEQEADQIRERAEVEAREKLDRARRALSELAGESPDPHPVEPEPAPPTAADTPAPVPAPASNGGDDSAARLVAMKMALQGKGRDEISTELDSRFGASDRGSLLDDVLARAGR